MPIGSIIGGLIGSAGAQASGGAAAAAGRESFNQAQDWSKVLNSWLSPWSASGKSASDEMTQLLGLGKQYNTGDTYGDIGIDTSNRAGDQANAFSRFKTSPDYQFRLREGTNALDRSAASRGMVLSGAQTRATQQFGGDLASGEYNNYFNKLKGLSDSGQGATTTAVGAGTSLGNTGINALQQGNMARASSYSNSANALANGIGGAINSLGTLYGMGAFSGFGGGGGGMGAAGTPGSSYYGPVYSGY